MLMGDYKLLRRWRDDGVLVQVTAMSITGGFGKGVQRQPTLCSKQAWSSFIASDAHAPHGRSPILSRAFDKVTDEFGIKTAERIFFVNPEEILLKVGSYKGREAKGLT